MFNPRAWVRSHWPPLRLRTILLSTFIVCAALPGAGALFLRVYENTLVRQTEAELVAQGAALAATVSPEAPPALDAASRYAPEPPQLDLRANPILPGRPAPVAARGSPDPAAQEMAARLAPVMQATARTTLAAIILTDGAGRILTGRETGRSYANLPEIRSALAGRPATLLRRNDSYRARYAFEWLSRASNLRSHHARPILRDGRLVGVLLLSRSPRALFRGIYEDRGKIAFGVVAILFTLIVLSGLLSRGIARPIAALGSATRAVAAGGGHVPDPPRTAAIEIQALYRDFAAMAGAIEHRSRYLRDFAHAVSHEFKTPLAGIRGAIELLEDHPDMAPADRERFLANARTDADRLTHLTTRLLELARADMAQPQAERADVAAIVRRLADAHAGAAFQVVADLPPLPPAALPAPALEAVLAGLIENSRQAGACTVTLSAARDAAAIALTVADDGPGIPPTDAARIFEPFFTTRRAAGGTGLGLSIARSLLAAHGGGIEAASVERGAAFVLTLPTASSLGG